MNREIMKAEDSYDFYKEETLMLHDRINKAINYINNHQLVFQDATKNEIQDWFDMFYKELLDILKGCDNNDNR